MVLESCGLHPEEVVLPLVDTVCQVKKFLSSSWPGPRLECNVMAAVRVSWGRTDPIACREELVLISASTLR